LILSLAVLWELAARLWEIQPWLLPAPTQILSAGAAARELLGPHLWQTAQETLWGFALALAVGLSLGVLIELSPLLRNALYPLLVVSQTIPTIAIAPLLAIWLGYGIWPKIIVVGLVCFFPIVVSTADGLRGVDQELVALLRTMGASQADIFRLVRLPGALPAIFSGVKIAVTYSVVGAILGEWVGASRGLGVFMLRASNSFRTDWVFASIAITAALSVCLFALVALVERLALRWRYAAGRGERWEEL
jgi:ABC-type nitrate/sulfonate/bicarbonate transport system permease component